MACPGLVAVLRIAIFGRQHRMRQWSSRWLAADKFTKLASGHLVKTFGADSCHGMKFVPHDAPRAARRRWLERKRITEIPAGFLSR
jgi:hypothetical protein